METSLRLLKDYARGWSQSIPSSERILHANSLSTALAKDKGDRSSTFTAYLDVAELSTSSLLKQAGGGAYAGDAIVPPEGIRESGTFWTIGPLLYFSGNSGNSGFLDKSYEQSQDTGIEMTLRIGQEKHPAPPIGSQSVYIPNNWTILIVSDPDKLISLPMDPSLGKALVIEGSEPTLLEEMQKGWHLDLPHSFLCPRIGINRFI